MTVNVLKTIIFRDGLAKHVHEYTQAEENMRKFIFSVLGGMAIATPALADEANWTGPYVGVIAGWNATRSDTAATLGGTWSTEAAATRTAVIDGLAARQSNNNGNIGAILGYNYQTGGIILGLEAGASTIGGSNERITGPISPVGISALNFVFSNKIDPKSLISVKSRLGAAVGSHTMIYATGGWAWVDANHSASITSNGNYKKLGELGKTHNGFIVGAGIEHKLDSHLSIRAQYDYTDQGDVTYATAYLPGSAFTSPAYSETLSQDLRLHLLRVGVSYNF